MIHQGPLSRSGAVTGMTVPRVTGVSDRWQSELSSKVSSLNAGPDRPLPAAGWQGCCLATPTPLPGGILTITSRSSSSRGDGAADTAGEAAAAGRGEPSPSRPPPARTLLLSQGAQGLSVGKGRPLRADRLISPSVGETVCSDRRGGECSQLPARGPLGPLLPLSGALSPCCLGQGRSWRPLLVDTSWDRAPRPEWRWHMGSGRLQAGWSLGLGHTGGAETSAPQSHLRDLALSSQMQEVLEAKEREVQQLTEGQKEVSD